MTSSHDTTQPDKAGYTDQVIELEEKRLEQVTDINDYNMIHERHRIFPAIFEDRNHKKLLDIAAGVGVAAARIKNSYTRDIICNDITPKCLSILRNLGLKTVSFNIDTESAPFPVENEAYDAIICLSTIEHVYNIDHFVSEIRRMLTPGGYLYLSAPNYNGLGYLLYLLRTGKTFHDPLNKRDKYEFYAHLRYFTYQTLIEYIGSFGFAAEAVYLGLPQESTKFLRIKEESKFKAFIIHNGIKFLYTFFSPRWCTEPVICFKKSENADKLKPRKVVL